MPPSTQKRLGWSVLAGTIVLGVLLQITFNALWLYRQRPTSAKSAQMISEPVFLWPVIALFLLPFALGFVLVCLGHFHHHFTSHDNAA